MADGVIKTLVTTAGLVTAATKNLVAGADVQDGTLAYAKIQPTAAPSVLLGRGSAAGAGALQEVSLGAHLSLTGTVLDAIVPPGYTDAAAVDAVAGALADSSTIGWGYDSGVPSLAAVVLPHSIGNTQLRQGSAASVVARAPGTAGDLADLASSADGQFLVRRAGALTFSVLVGSDIPPLDAADITTGVFPVARGGTGQAVYAVGDVLYASATGTLSRLAGNASAARQFLMSQGSGATPAAPAWAVLLAADIPGLDAAAITSGFFPVARGGTGANMSATGGPGQFVKQLTTGGAFSTFAINAAELPVMVAAGASAARGAAPAPGGVAHPNIPYVLGDNAAWGQPFGRMLGVTVVNTAESSTSTANVPLTTLDRVTVTLDENCNLLLIFNCNQYINTANFNVRNTFYLNGSPLSGGFDVGFPAVNLSASVTHLYRVNLNAGTYNIDVYHAVPNGGQGTWYGRTLAVFLSK